VVCGVAVLGSLALLFGAFVLWFVVFKGPPKEAKLVQDFRTHRESFERLRDMLESDTHIRRLADWGVETDKGMFKPPAGNFPVDRYNRYLELLKLTGGKGAGRGEGAHANPIILLWASGFGGDTAHIGISWMDEAPGRQISSLKQYYQDHKAPAGNGCVYQHLDEKWYLWTDLWTR
jgi:hypothetical protein